MHRKAESGGASDAKARLLEDIEDQDGEASSDGSTIVVRSVTPFAQRQRPILDRAAKLTLTNVLEEEEDEEELEDAQLSD
ncbi:unnamed protein product [Gongylonema pulchrum]|uniref:Uncharacterized protein n=1 Tax=Gongylonema pulchrum TaxID=637853 RepID=A0A183DPW1_9BILA|nr:unnamed protein product [Gongylonema pulchrum]